MVEPLKKVAVCGHHLGGVMRFLVPDNTFRTLRVRSIAKPDDHFFCSCGRAARWYVQQVVQT